MARTEHIIGLDIGTTLIRCIVAQRSGSESPTILGIGSAPSLGIRRGAVVDVEETVNAISKALDNAEKITGVPVEHAYVALGGSHIQSQLSKGVIAVSKADGEITEDDVSRVINAAQAVSLPSNREIIHVIPKDYIVDGQEGVKDPVGMTGVRLEVIAHIIDGSTPFIKNLTKCVYQAGVDINDLVISPLAVSKAVLSKRQKELGVMVLDLGGAISGLTVYEEGDLLHVAVLPVGAVHITNDIAIGLRTSIDVAEKVKLEYGTALPGEVGSKEEIDLGKIDKNETEKVSRHHVAEIIEARVEEIFKMAEKELRKIKRVGLLPAGVVLCGGGAKLPGVVDLAKKSLKLPAQIGFPHELPGVIDKIDDPAYATAVGLILWAIEDQEKHLGRKNLVSSSWQSSVSKIRKWFKTFLP